MSKKTFLQTERVRLVEITKEDIPLLMDLDSDPEVMKHLTGGRPSTQEEVQAGMNRILKVVEKYQYKFGFWLAYLKETDEFMGWFLFRPGKKTPDDDKNIELGYRLKKKHWGQGYATEVSLALVALGLEKYKLDSIFAITLKANTASQNVMKKIGMTWVTDYTEDDFPGADKSAVRYAIQRIR